jgi:hypothetical protein
MAARSPDPPPPRHREEEMTMRIQITIEGRTYPIHRDVTHKHPEAVHEALGTASEAELQHALDTLHVSDWYDGDGQHLGPDTNGMEMFRSVKAAA